MTLKLDQFLAVAEGIVDDIEKNGRKPNPIPIIDDKVDIKEELVNLYCIDVHGRRTDYKYASTAARKFGIKPSKVLDFCEAGGLNIGLIWGFKE